jgi:hypothetical protein
VKTGLMKLPTERIFPGKTLIIHGHFAPSSLFWAQFKFASNSWEKINT